MKLEDNENDAENKTEGRTNKSVNQKVMETNNTAESSDDKDIWLRMVFKGNKVWVEKSADGMILLNNGRARVKYNLSHDQEYLVNPSNLGSLDDLPEKDQKKESVRKKPAGSRKKPETKTEDNHDNRNKLNNNELTPESCNGHNPDSITVYTDGASSGNPGPSGIGIYFLYGRHEREISEYIGEATNNIAELEAIRRALAEIKRNDLPIRIHSDSSYAIGLLTKDWKPKKNQELVAEIKKLLAGFRNVEFIKVSGHSGIPGNEKADSLATGAIERHVMKK